MKLHLPLLPLLLALTAVLVRFWIAPLATRLPADYVSETKYAADVRFRESPAAEWQEFPLQARRVDQTLLVTADVAILQGESHWTTEDGTPTYEPIGLYGVNRRTRINLPGYGDTSRSGQYLFPTHLESVTYTFWDPYYSGPRTATFEREDQLNGLHVFVFNYTAVDIDDTPAYTMLPGVPQRYRAISTGAGKLWIEPVSGVIVNFEDKGMTELVDNKTGEHVADFYHWTAQYTDETRAQQLTLARRARFRILTFETWLPLGLLALAVAAFWLTKLHVGVDEISKEEL